MPTQLDKLIAAQERAEQQNHEAERKAKLAKKQIAELQRKERNHRLIVRGAYLEKLLREPEIYETGNNYYSLSCFRCHTSSAADPALPAGESLPRHLPSSTVLQAAAADPG